MGWPSGRVLNSDRSPGRLGHCSVLLEGELGPTAHATLQGLGQEPVGSRPGKLEGEGRREREVIEEKGGL